MALEVLDDLCEFNDMQAKVILESSLDDGGLAYIELRSADCRRKAIQYAAQKGLPSPAVNGTVQAYPVDKDGKEVVDAKTQKVYRFRAEVPITRKIV